MHFFKNRFVIGCICIVLAVAIGFIGVPLLSKAENKKITVMIAKDSISKGSEVTMSMLSEHKISKGDMPYDGDTYYLASTINDYFSGGGKFYASCDIEAHDIMTANKLSSQYPYTDMAIRTLDDTHYAVAAGVSSLSAGVAGKIREGDVLTLMICPDKDKVFIDSYLNYVKVISVSNSEASDIKDGTETNGSRIPSVITFEVNIDQAMLLAEYNSNYGIHYALAARADTDKAQKLLSDQDKMLSEEHKYGRLAGDQQ